MCAQRNEHPAQTTQVAIPFSPSRNPMKEELAAAAAKTAPPAAVAGSHALFGMPLSEWVAVATLIYIGLQAVVLIRNEFIRRRDK